MPANTQHRGHLCPVCNDNMRSHNRSCRFERCTEHCSCTAQERREFREYAAGQEPQRCYHCRTPTLHRCEAMTATNLPIGEAVCAAHCHSCSNQSNRCQQAYAYSDIPRLDEHCYIHNIPLFPNTDRCDRCDENGLLRACRRCEGITTICNECSSCYREGHSSNCCRCDINQRPRLVSHVLTMKWTGGYTTKRNPLHRALGVELEIAGFVKPKRSALENLYNTCVMWNAGIGTDGSVVDPTGNNSSVEIRTSPAAGDHFVNQITAIVRAVRAANGVVNRSCGMHVHVDARDWYSVVPIINTIDKVWLDIQETMFAIVAPWRPQAYNGTIYCARNRLGDSLFGNRYRALNFNAIGSHRTIEFRLHHGCLQTRAIIGWATLCGAVIEWCVKNQHTNITDPVAFLRMVAPTPEAAALVKYAPRRWKRPQEHTIWQKAA